MRQRQLWNLGIAATVVLAVLTLIQDRIAAVTGGTGYYFSESFLFSSFWWLFVPFWHLQFRLQKQDFWVLLLTPALLHLAIYPLWIYTLSAVFFEHRFAPGQTLRFALSVYLYILVFLYALPAWWYRYGRRHIGLPTTHVPVQGEGAYFETSILVQDGAEKRAIPVTDILYISANTPYINLHLAHKTYLHSDTLRAISERLHPAQFVRIHKSLIVNIRQVRSYRSRLNGDYDLTLENGAELRVSRHYAAYFKKCLQASHRLALS